MSLNEESQEARLCKAKYGHCRDFVLRQRLWMRAAYRAELPRHTSPPVFGFKYRYALPSDPYCLRVWELEGNHAWQIYGSFLETDAETARITYVGRVEDPNQLDSTLVEAVSYYLAQHIAKKLTGDSNLKQEMMQMYLAVLSEADQVQGYEKKLKQEVDPPEDSFLAARR